jgi:hypothetical protein
VPPEQTFAEKMQSIARKMESDIIEQDMIKHDQEKEDEEWMW